MVSAAVEALSTDDWSGRPPLPAWLLPVPILRQQEEQCKQSCIVRINLTGVAVGVPALVDLRGAIFPDEYHEILVFDTESITHAFEQYPSELGDVIFLGEGEELEAYVAAPFGWEVVKFGREWRSPA